jgi:outer membrane protein OmpA-like peptidoglycan-associated protein
MRRLLAGCLLLALAACAEQLPTSGTRFPVFFETWSAAIDPAATRSIQAAADLAKQNPTARVVVVGYADPTGSAQANLDISRARAQMVADALVQNGVPAERIRRAGKGEAPVIGDLQESRRVDIIIAPQ